MTMDEHRTEQQILVRQVTHVQASWTEAERGQRGAFTMQLILDQVADEYIMRPDPDDLKVLLQLLQMSDSASFDLNRKVLMFSNLAMKSGASS